MTIFLRQVWFAHLNAAREFARFYDGRCLC